MVWLLTVVLAGLVVALVWSRFARALAAARARVARHSLMMASSFGPLEYAVLGEGAPVLGVHGASGGFDQTLDMLGDLAASGFRLIAPSRFGYLRSALPPDASAAAQADAYLQLLDHLGVDRAAVVGVSAGAWSCLQFAIRHPKRCSALVLLVPADALPPGVSMHGGALAKLLLGSDLLAWAAAVLAPAFPAMAKVMLGTPAEVLRKAEPPERARVQCILDHLLPLADRAAGTLLDLRTAASPGPYRLDEIRRPVLAISAEDDLFGTAARARAIAGAVGDGRAVVFASGGHALVGRHAAALREVVAFLNDVSFPRSTARPPAG
jgi:pimeloyl-ACP methyl ester carboxylesterase